MARKSKTPTVPEFMDFSSSGRPLRTLENIEALMVHAGIEHRYHSEKNGDSVSGWHITVGGQVHGDRWPGTLAELSSIARRYGMISPKITDADMLALRWRHAPKEWNQ